MHLSLGWRLGALATVFVYVLLVFVTVSLVAHSLGLVLIFVPTAAVLAYAVWLSFTGTPLRARIGALLMIISLAALTLEAVYFLRDKSDRRAVLVILALSALYMALAGTLHQRYWRKVRRTNELTKTTAQFQKPFLIINPKSGNGRAMKAHIDVLAEKQGITVLFTKKGEDVQEVAKRAVNEGADVLGVSGGDGSLGAVAKVAIDRHLPVVILPGGTRCHFARDLGLEPKRIADALAGFHGVERLVDVADINGRVFLNNASFGLYADIVDTPGYREHKMQVSRDVLRAIVSGSKGLYDLHFKHGALRVQEAVQILVGVNLYDTFDVFELGHRERLDAGMLQITAVTQLNDTTMRELLSSISTDKIGKYEKFQDVFQWVDKSFSVTNSSGKIVAGVDGEREEYTTPLTIRIKPLALRIFVPAEGVRNRPRNPFSPSVVRRIGDSATLVSRPNAITTLSPSSGASK